MKMKWVSRHDLTNGQKSLLPLLGFNSVEKINVVFENDPVGELNNIGISPPTRIGVVAPLSVGLVLLRAGYEIIEFRNFPSARNKGVFLCEGAFIHTLDQSEWIGCPMSPEDQEEGDLSPAK
jgi:hypothetical protein